jgi:hypothetical protein
MGGIRMGDRRQEAPVRCRGLEIDNAGKPARQDDVGKGSAGIGCFERQCMHTFGAPHRAGRLAHIPNGNGD